MNDTKSISRAESDADERCVRCGETGEDRRTLWMACFYAMEELGVPFERCAIRGTYMRHVRDEPSELLPGITFPRFEAEAAEREFERAFYTLRVCKNCRAEWMQAIKDWFTQDSEIGRPTGTGVYVRRNGATVEATEAEVQRMLNERA